MIRSSAVSALPSHASAFERDAHRRIRRGVYGMAVGLVALVVGATAPQSDAFLSTAFAGDQLAISASEGLQVATSAALAWADDAELVYVENDEPVDATGSAGRWGYLFRSQTRDRSRGYSVQGAKVVQAADLALRFDSPPLGSWVDSQRALAAAEEKQGAKFRAESGGELAHMVLIRSAADPKKPERTSWLVIYRAPGLPSLFVLVDAATGNVDRTWRG